jgi:hypothetical protein
VIVEGAGIVDEFWLKVNPVAIGRGGPVFADLEDPAKLERLSVVPTEVDRRRPPHRPRHETMARRGPGGLNSPQPESKENPRWAKS